MIFFVSFIPLSRLVSFIVGLSSFSLFSFDKHGRRPGAEFGGAQKKFRGLFREKFPFSRRKILMTFFKVIDQVFLILTLSFQILFVFILSNVIYDPFLSFFTTK